MYSKTEENTVREMFEYDGVTFPFILRGKIVLSSKNLSKQDKKLFKKLREKLLKEPVP